MVVISNVMGIVVGFTHCPAEGEIEGEGVERVDEGEGIGAEHGRGGASERTGARRRRRLVLLQTQREARAARLRTANAPGCSPYPPATAARARRQLQPVVGELQDL